jgi:cell division inhibitor SepF
MSTLHKVKQYFGMVPLENYDDAYLDQSTPEPRGRRPRDEYDSYGDYRESDYRSDDYRDRDREPRGGFSYDGRRRPEYSEGYRSEREYDDYADDYREQPRTELPRRLEPLRSDRPAPSTRGALAMDARLEEPPAAQIVTLHPVSFEDARVIGEKFRDGVPVIMNLTEMEIADARRLVDFAAGLAFALRGSIDPISKKVFMLSPAGVNVTAEERAQIAETGFYNR